MVLDNDQGAPDLVKPSSVKVFNWESPLQFYIITPIFFFGFIFFCLYLILCAPSLSLLLFISRNVLSPCSWYFMALVSLPLPTLHFSPHLTLKQSFHPSFFFYPMLCPCFCLTAPLGRDGGDSGQGAGGADQGPFAAGWRAVHGQGHGPAGWAAGRSTPKPNPWWQRQRCSQPHQGTALLVERCAVKIIFSMKVYESAHNKKETGETNLTVEYLWNEI